MEKTAWWEPAAGKTRRMVKLSVAALFTVVALTASAPERAEAQAVDPSIADSDGYVPIYEVCLPADPGLGDIGGGYVPYSPDGVTVEGYILLNVCALEELGAGPNDIEYVIRHELGHAAGLLHSDDPNDFMYPAYRITGT